MPTSRTLPVQDEDRSTGKGFWFFLIFVILSGILNMTYNNSGCESPTSPGTVLNLATKSNSSSPAQSPSTREAKPIVYAAEVKRLSFLHGLTSIEEERAKANLVVLLQRKDLFLAQVDHPIFVQPHQVESRILGNNSPKCSPYVPQSVKKTITYGVCNLSPLKSMLGHPAHFMKRIGLCYSFFEQIIPAPKRRIIVVDDSTHHQSEDVINQAFIKSVLDILELEVLPAKKNAVDYTSLEGIDFQQSGHCIKLHYGCFNSIIDYLKDNFLAVKTPAVIGLKHAYSFRDRVIKKNPVRDDGRINVGVLNRERNRRINNGRALVKLIESKYRAKVSYLNDMTLSGHKTFESQASWMNTQDIIFSPHGQQLSTLFFTRPCTIVVELFPRGFFAPDYFAGLATSGGAEYFALYSGSKPISGTLPYISTMRDRHAHRDLKVLNITVEHIMEILPILDQRRRACCVYKNIKQCPLLSTP